jgi:hypothetical protein
MLFQKHLQIINYETNILFNTSIYTFFNKLILKILQSSDVDEAFHHL